MIPKVIHYCWFGGKEKSPFIKKCMATWRKVMPDYTWKEWNETNFDLESVPFVRDAYKAKKWAFVADYIRLYALYTEGGVYMDTDVKVLRPFDEFLKYDFFSSHEIQLFFNEKSASKLNEEKRPINPDEYIKGWAILSAVMGAVSHCPFIKDCIQHYQNLSFYEKDGKMNLDFLIIGRHLTRVALKYGFRYEDVDQLLDNNMMIKKSDIFVGNTAYLKPYSYAIHLCNGSWFDESNGWIWRLRNYYPAFYPILSILIRIFNKLKRIVSH